MPNLTPNEIDDLFRAGSAQFDFEYNPSAWMQMERLLDKERRRRFFIIWFWRLGLGFCLLSAISGLYLTVGKNATSSKITSSVDVAKLPYPTLSDTCLYSNFNTSLPHLSDTLNKKIPAAIALPAEPKYDTTYFDTTNPVTTAPIGDADFINLITIREANQETNQIEEVLSSHELNNDSSSFAPLELLTSNSMILSATNWQLADSMAPKPAANLNISAMQKSKYLRFGVQTTAELTGAGNWSDFSDWGWKAGISVEYIYSRQWSLGIGLLYSYKPYVADGADYRASGYYPNATSLKKIQSAEGVCDILEIPLEWTYYFKESPANNNFFAKAGLNSYWMVREQYHIAYQYPDSTAFSDIAVYNEHKHWLAIGEVSVGYQRHLGNQWRVQVIPYLQFPFRGVGKGDILLYSAGTTFRLYYTKQKK